MQERNVHVIDGDAVRPPGEPAQSETSKGGKQRRRRGAHVGDHRGGWPRLAAACSILVSGSGHFLHRRWKAGFFYLFAFGFTLAFHYFLSELWPGLMSLAGRYQLGEIDLLFGVLLMDSFLIVVLLLGVYTAYAVGQARTGGETNPALNPFAPALASMLVPGSGQVVNGQIKKAMVFLFFLYAGVLAVAVGLALPGPIERLLLSVRVPLQLRGVFFGLATAAIVGWTLSLYDAALVARYRRL